MITNMVRFHGENLRRHVLKIPELLLWANPASKPSNPMKMLKAVANIPAYCIISIALLGTYVDHREAVIYENVMGTCNEKEREKE